MKVPIEGHATTKLSSAHNSQLAEESVSERRKYSWNSFSFGTFRVWKSDDGNDDFAKFHEKIYPGNAANLSDSQSE